MNQTRIRSVSFDAGPAMQELYGWIEPVGEWQLKNARATSQYGIRFIGEYPNETKIFAALVTYSMLLYSLDTLHLNLHRVDSQDIVDAAVTARNVRVFYITHKSHLNHVLYHSRHSLILQENYSWNSHHRYYLTSYDSHPITYPASLTYG